MRVAFSMLIAPWWPLVFLEDTSYLLLQHASAGPWEHALDRPCIGVNAYDRLIIKWNLFSCSTDTVRRVLSVASLLGEWVFFTQSLIVLAYILSTISKIHTHTGWSRILFPNVGGLLGISFRYQFFALVELFFLLFNKTKYLYIHI
jgi:hypothetical protein